MANSTKKVAVVGLGCVLPDAKSPSEFWDNVLRGHSALRPLSSKTYDWNRYGRESAQAARVFQRPLGAELDDSAFDWRKFKISPLDAQAMNPMHLHVLEAGAQAIEEVKNIPHHSAGVFVGGTGLGWRMDAGLRIRLEDFLQAAETAGKCSALSEDLLQESLQSARRTLEERLRPVSDDGVVNSLGSIAAGRLALRFDLRGPHAGIDAGFASGLAALSTAARLLLDGTIDLALAGAASESISPLELLALHHLAVLAPNHVRPFDSAAEGTLLGEGVALFALKRLEDAIRDGEKIYAVLCGVGTSSDGRSGSLLAPSADGQSLALQRAYAEAAIEPNTVGYVECHATGTPMGDATELRTLTHVFGKSPSGIALGSAKPFVGHLRGASGAVGLLRAVLVLHHGVVPAQIGFEKAHPALGIESSPFLVPTHTQPLEPREGARTARAGVNSFGLGGVNYHAVLEAFDVSAADATRDCEKPRLVRADEPIAIIGIGGVLPDAPDIASFWNLLVEGSDTTREVPGSRWNIDRYYDTNQKRTETSYTRIGCFVEPLPPPTRNLRVAPIAQDQLDPGQVIAYRAAEQAIRDAGLESSEWDKSRTAVIFGFIPCQGRRHLAEARLNFCEFEEALEQALLERGVDKARISAVIAGTQQTALADLPSITEDTLPGYLGSFNAARIARLFDLRGPHFVVESACSSSLAALHAASRLLRQRVVDTVILGGVWADGQPEFFVQNCRFSALSPSGITPFDERASGFVPGEGAAVLVLRRVADAERDAQHIHAVIRSVEGSTDGMAGRSVYAPSAEGESLAAKRALDAADIDPGTVDYVECHGTGTALGDVTEVDACTRAYGTGRRRPLLIGSVKSNIGHLMAGAGAASLLKTTLAVREGLIPASLKVKKLNPKIDFGTGPVEVVTELRKWAGLDGQPRRAGVSGFGLGGTNYHVILEQYVSREISHVAIGGGPAETAKRASFLPIATAQARDVAACAAALKAQLASAQNCPGQQFAEQLAQSRVNLTESAPCRAAIVADDPSVLAQRLGILESAIAKGHDLSLLRAKGVFVADCHEKVRVAAMFPGQGPQYPNMLCDAAAEFPELARQLDRIDDAYEGICGRKLRPSYCTDDPDSYLQSDEDIHCAVFGANVALFEFLQSYGARVDALVGQSAGELSALVAARTISLEDGLRAIRERTLAVLGIRSSDPGSMVTLTCGAERAASLMRGLPGYAALAADNGPSACIVSGDRKAVEALLRRATDEGIKATVLAVSHGYHSQLIAAARPRYRSALESIRFERPSTALYSTITGTRIDDLPLTDYPAHLESQFVEPVRLRQAITALHRDGVRFFIECGPKWPLSTFVSEILTGLPYVAQATVHPKVGEVEQLHRALASLFVHRICSLSPVRESSMSVQNIPRSVSTVPKTRDAPVQNNSRERLLLDALRSVRDLIDSALTAYENAGDQRPTGLVLPITAPVQMSVASGVSEPASPIRSDPVVVTPAVAVPKVGQQEVRSHIETSLVGELVKRTGYPEDMLEPDLDLEAELGIDTVKQVASLAAVRERFGLAADPAFRMQDARTLRQAIDYLTARVMTAEQSQNTPGVGRSNAPAITLSPGASKPSFNVRQISAQRPEAQHYPTSPVANPSPATPVPPAPSRASVAATATSETATRLLLTELVTRTGYPEDMLELDLDLEAELGIDTVKQVAALAAVREKLGLPQDPQFRMQDARTLRQAVAYLDARLRARSSQDHVSVHPPPVAQSQVAQSSVPTPPALQSSPHAAPPAAGMSPSAAPQPPHEASIAEFSTALNELREYVHSLALLVGQGSRREQADKELPAATIPSVAYSTPAQTNTPSAAAVVRSVYPEVLLESILPHAGYPQSGEALELTCVAIADSHRELPPIVPHQADVTPLHARDADSQIVAGSRHVQLGYTPSSAAPSMLNAVAEGRASADNRLLQDYLTRSGRLENTSVLWAYSQGFTTTVGAARMPANCCGPRSMLTVLGSCFDVASFAWFRLTGALHALSGIARVYFHRVPQPDEELLIWAHMAHPVGGFWRADVSVFDPSGNLFAEISGMEGMPVGANGHIETEATDPAERAWRRFARRTGRDGAVSEEIAS